MPGPHRGKKVDSDSLKLEMLRVVKYPMGAGN